MKATGWVRLYPWDTVRFGGVECVFEPDALERLLYRLGFSNPKESWKSFVPSLVLHLIFLVLFSQAVLIVARKEVPDFESQGGSTFLVEPGPKGEPPGGEAAAGPKMLEPEAAPSLEVAPSALSMISTTAPSALNFSVPAISVRSSISSPQAMGGGVPGRGGGGSSYRSAGLGSGSGIGRGVGEWIGGGSGGLGISGRGKTLKTVNEFSVYFVIHSGDWYAALDTRKAPESRQKEESPVGLPDVKNIQWLNWKPVPNTGPFINYFWGIRDVRGGEDIRHSLVEFTPGAMGNLLKFVRQASADNIKGSGKPKAVVLDKTIVPYQYDALTKATTWNPEGREKLRETLRKGLPVFDNLYGGAYGYIWNPKPEDKSHPDFTVEYLLDVKPMPPFIYFTGNDDFVLSEAEVETLYQYILRGGAIWGDSGFAGNRSKFDAAFKREMKRVIPDVDKPFRALKKENDLFVAGSDAYFDKSNEFDRLPYGMQYYDAPIEVIEVLPGVVSVVLTKNAYGNFLRFETVVINNRFQTGGELGRGTWANTMWKFREEFFRGLDNESIIDSYKLGTNILVYMLGRWPAVLNRPENKALTP
jgi:hypothetical protein